ncbi:LysR family transcriptional regulator [Novosphingopyxis sp. YJ-S2-01]|uniref:LysR family transcriptional regulator n=1 Tax=Novosphingopyxis sp. YJ-S2-01 TaxID=2794021 RepID=UPI0018DB5F77|nr:LysR family transcriptional regulator [Novosphingopyxis sp. YJ-S2-01]MBH9538282.1 LysR family transcriptional regulator [Novosphingopyxis sp. YJ-S2-01]
MKRTLLPLNGLRVFDAAARHLSFTRAADELAVTPAAVGQQIRALEDVLGVVLFRRAPKGLELTPEGTRGLEALRAGFLQFEDSVRAMQQGQGSKRLTIAAPRDISRYWLLPRLADYAKSDEDFRFQLIAADEPLDFTEANVDLAVRYTADPGDIECLPLGEQQAVWVGEGERVCWEGGAGGDIRLSVADAGLALEAARAGIGRARIPHMLAEAAGADWHDAETARRRYWLVAPLPQWRQAKVRALVEALNA